MKRQEFIKSALLTSATACFAPLQGLKAKQRNEDTYPELSKHKVIKAEMVQIDYHWPRFVGKNGRIDFHGKYKQSTILKLHTDQGAMGWGLTGKDVEEIIPLMVNKKVSDLIIPDRGIVPGLNKTADFALFDLAGIILNKPVFELLGSYGPRENLVYSGMIYLDELNPENTSKGFDAVLENCDWDYNYGYRQLKVKIGRSGRWYPHDIGLKKDIEIVQRIYDRFKDQKVDVLVDSNDMYSLQDTKDFLSGIIGIPLFWVEEPFREELALSRGLRSWMNENGFSATLYVDGEANPDYDLCLKLGEEKVLDVYLPDIFGLGFSEWIALMPKVKALGMKTSPHAWGDRLKTNYIAHIASGLGNVVTIEGVTCLSDNIDYGDYPIIDGKLQTSKAPGFGMKLI